ncbi:MAG: stage III sporulation protein AF [Bacillota bacterium]
METLRVLVQNLIIIVILAVLLEMLLPGGEMRRYTKMVLGLMVIVAVIQAFNGLTGGAFFNDIEEYAWRSVDDPAKAIDILASGKKIDEENKKKAMEQYRRGIEKQVAGLAGMTGEVSITGAVVKIQDDPEKNNFGKIEEISLLASKSSSRLVKAVEPVSVSLGDKDGAVAAGDPLPPEYAAAAKSAAGKVASFYNLSPDQVKVVFK